MAAPQALAKFWRVPCKTAGAGLAVTVAGYVTPSGRDIQDAGIEPDRLLSNPEPLNPGGEGDRWLNEAEQWMASLLELDSNASIP